MTGKKNECTLHGAGARTVNKALIGLIVLSFSLMAWHVWNYGPLNHAHESPAKHALEIQASGIEHSFIEEMVGEMWDLFLNDESVLSEVWNVLPYFLIGIFLAGFIRTFKLAINLRNSLVKYGFLSIFIASLVGILTPLCACGVLTTVISLLYAGLPLAPAMALLISSPLISPSTYLLTLNDLGPEWTAIRVIAAFLMGIFAGVVTHLIRKKGFQTDDLFIEGAIIEGDFHDENYPDERLKCGCKQKFGNRVAAKTDNLFIIFLAKSYDMLWLVGKYVLVGITMGAVIGRYIPGEWIYRLFGQKDPLNVVWISLGTIPIFLHQISASSILYHIKTSLQGTLDGGAGLAFLIGGPVTAIPAMTMLWALFKKRVFILYMLLCITGTIFFSYTFNYFVIAPDTDMGHPLLAGVTAVTGGESSVITKTNKKVRTVMDPDRQNIVATYYDPVEGTGGIVFDAGYERFIKIASAGNKKYVQNVAEWLEETGGSGAERSILIYSTNQSPGSDMDRLKPVSGILESQSEFKVTVTERKETPELSDELLQGYGQLWLIAGKSGGQIFSDAELEAVKSFVDDGNSILLAAGPYGSDSEAAINQIASGFGVTFHGRVNNEEELRVSSGFSIFGRLATMLTNYYRAIT